MTTDNPAIHRLLDEAFAGIELTPDVQDLKEEVRGNLAARASELQASGMDASAAAQAAITELGPIRALVDDLGPAASMTVAERHEHYRVRPKPGFVVRTVLLALVLAADAALVVLSAVGIVPVVTGVVAGVVASVALGVIVADSLRQETSQNYRLPTRRAVLFGASATAALLGLTFLAQLAHVDTWLVVVGGLLAVASLVGFIWLGVTQTNRKKAWALELSREYSAEDRFSKDPAAAARFGLYTVVIWTLAGVGFVVLSMTVGFAWSWLSIVAGFVVFFLVLAQMLFGAGNGARKDGQS